MAVLVKGVNRNGIPCIQSIGATLDDSRLTIRFASHANVSDNFQGLFLVYINSLPADLPTGELALPIYLQTEGYLGSEKQLFTAKSDPVSTNEIKVGVYLCFYDSTTGLVRVMM